LILGGCRVRNDVEIRPLYNVANPGQNFLRFEFECSNCDLVLCPFVTGSTYQ
jgi:hypothetical protein